MLRFARGRGSVPRSRPGDFDPAPENDGAGPKFAELFDIYLMSFSGDARVIATELQRAFRIDASAARRLVAQLPVVVKRRVEPELAAQYFDVLANMGVQVVLLPSPQSSAPPAPTREPDARDSEPAPEVSFDARAPHLAHDSEPAPEMSFEPMASAPRPPPDPPATPQASFEPEEFDFSMPSHAPSAAPDAQAFAGTAPSASEAPDSSAETAAPSVTTMRELPRLDAATVFDTTSPFETMPPPAAANAGAAPATPWSMSPPDWGVFEKRDPTATLVATSTSEMDAQARAPSFPPLPPPAPSPTQTSANEPEGSWLNPLPKPKTATRDPGSGLFMAENADDFIGAGPRTTQTVPLPVIKPLRERPPSEAPDALPSVPSSLPPPVRLPPPPALPVMAAPAHPTPPRPPRPPAPGTGGGLIKPSIPPPVPLSAHMPTVSRRPPPIFDSSSEDPSVLRLEFDKVPPLPSVSIAPVPPNQIDVDPGDLASLPRIELEGARDEAARGTGAQSTSVLGGAKRPPEPELASLPPLGAPRPPISAPGVRAPVAAPKTPTLGAGPAPVGRGVGGASPPPPPGTPKASASGATRPTNPSARAGRLGRLRLPPIPDGVRRAAYAFGLFGCAGAIFAFGVRVDSSVLYGNASLPAVLLHAFALYAVGAGILGMFRS